MNVDRGRSVDFQWRKLTIADKVDSTRTIPLSPYLAQLLATLSRVGIDALRPFLERIETHILHLAGVQFTSASTSEGNRLRLVQVA